jgi:phage host-nuclease inhibitor protein Gam
MEGIGVILEEVQSTLKLVLEQVCANSDSIKRLDQKIDNVGDKLTKEIWRVEGKLTKRIDNVETKLTKEIREVKTEVKKNSKRISESEAHLKLV